MSRRTWFRKGTTVPEDTQLLTTLHNLTYAGQRASLALPVTTCCQSSPMVVPGLALFTSPTAVVLPCRKDSKSDLEWSLNLFSSQGVGAFSCKGHGPVSFPKTSSARWGQDQVFLLPGVLEELSLLSLSLFSVWDIFSAGGEEASFHQKTTTWGLRYSCILWKDYDGLIFLGEIWNSNWKCPEWMVQNPEIVCPRAELFCAQLSFKETPSYCGLLCRAHSFSHELDTLHKRLVD